MRKNIRKVPDDILEEIGKFDKNIRAEVIIEISANEIEEKFGRIGFRVESNGLSYPSSYLPNKSVGRYSRRNVNGYTVIRKDLPKVSKTFYCGERRPFGLARLTEFSLYISKVVYQRDEFGPKNNTILISLIQEYVKDEVKVYVVKFTVDEVLNKKVANFELSLLFNLNLLQENVGKFGVFPTNTTEQEYLKTVNVAWELLPPGEGNEFLINIMSEVKKLDEKTKLQISDRYEFLISLNPQRLIKGMSGMTRYFGFKFANNLVLLENVEYGNALYVLYENWQELSKLSRKELFNRTEKDFERIVHNKKYWKNQVKNLISDKL